MDNIGRRHTGRRRGQHAQQTFQAAARDCVASARGDWLAVPSSAIPLGEAHRLLRDQEIERGVKMAMVKLGQLLTGHAIIVRDAAGGCVIPFNREILAELRPAVLAALCDGRLVARGIDPHNAMGKPVTIPAERWEILTPDWEKSAATCEGKTVAVGIVVEAAATEPAPEAERPNPPSQKDLEAWFVAFKRDCDARGERPSAEATEAAAKQVFGGDRVRRAQVRSLRKKFARDWLPGKPGPKGPRNSAK